MKFRNHRADGVPFQKARHQRGKITPSIVVLHDTASRLEKGNAAAYLQDNSAGVSVHFVLERDGSVVQQVATNVGANHAGRSSYHGRDHCNNFSIGIEIVNPGYMAASGPNKARTWFGQVLDIDQFGIDRAWSTHHGDGERLWMPYTEAQIASLLDLLHGLFAYIPTLIDIQPHWYVSPGRKVDTNPLFPLEMVRSKVIGRAAPAEQKADDESQPGEADEWVRIQTGGDTLNMRRWPSFNPNVIMRIPDGTLLPVIRRGIFTGREWLRVAYGGQEGWIVGRYAPDRELLG